MRARLSLVLSSALALTACASSPTAPQAPPAGAGCHTDGPGGGKGIAGVDPGLLTGLGDTGFPAEHVASAAAPYYAQTLRLTHAFNAPDAMRTATVAERLQPDCALCFWADAWAQGPTINYSINAEEEGKARTAALKAKALSTGLSPKAQGLIDAMLLRYPAKPVGKDPASDNRAYADAMVRLADRFPEDNALSTEAASAILVASGRAWMEGKPTPGSDSDRAEKRLEAVLARSPNYAPAIHYYIHLEEWTHTPEKAAPYAERLAALAPNAGHLVHMPSHLWFRMGRYEAGADANSAASAADDKGAAELKVPGGVSKFALHGHNVSFGLASALMSGDRDQALALARRTRTEFPDSAFINVKAYQAFARELPPEETLALPAPKAAVVTLPWRYARTLAFLEKGDIGAAVKERALIVDPSKLDKDQRDLLALLRGELDGRIAFAEGRLPDAIAKLRQASDLRDRVDPGMDPPGWGWPPRRLLAVALLKKGDAAGAAKELQRSLERFKGDPLALYALSQAKRAQGATTEADKLLGQARAAWKGAPGDLSLAKA